MNTEAMAAFIAARLDEDEEAAIAARDANKHQFGTAEAAAHWHVAATGSGVRTADDAGVVSAPYSDADLDEETGRHITLHDPARALREVTVKRERLARLLALPHDWNPADEYYSCSQAIGDDSDVPGSGCSDPDRRGNPCDCGRDVQVERELRAEVSVWAGHPGYRQEWAL